MINSIKHNKILFLVSLLLIVTLVISFVGCKADSGIDSKDTMQEEQESPSNFYMVINSFISNIEDAYWIENDEDISKALGTTPIDLNIREEGHTSAFYTKDSIFKNTDDDYNDLVYNSIFVRDTTPPWIYINYDDVESQMVEYFRNALIASGSEMYEEVSDKPENGREYTWYRYRDKNGSESTLAVYTNEDNTFDVKLSVIAHYVLFKGANGDNQNTLDLAFTNEALEYYFGRELPKFKRNVKDVFLDNFSLCMSYEKSSSEEYSTAINKALALGSHVPIYSSELSEETIVFNGEIVFKEFNIFADIDTGRCVTIGLLEDKDEYTTVLIYHDLVDSVEDKVEIDRSLYERDTSGIENLINERIDIQRDASDYSLSVSRNTLSIVYNNATYDEFINSKITAVDSGFVEINNFIFEEGVNEVVEYSKDDYTYFLSFGADWSGMNKINLQIRGYIQLDEVKELLETEEFRQTYVWILESEDDLYTLGDFDIPSIREAGYDELQWGYFVDSFQQRFRGATREDVLEFVENGMAQGYEIVTERDDDNVLSYEMINIDRKIRVSVYRYKDDQGEMYVDYFSTETDRDSYMGKIEFK